MKEVDYLITANLHRLRIVGFGLKACIPVVTEGIDTSLFETAQKAINALIDQHYQALDFEDEDALKDEYVPDRILGFRIRPVEKKDGGKTYQKWYAMLQIQGEKAKIYIGDLGKAEEKIKAWLDKHLAFKTLWKEKHGKKR